MLVFCLSEVSSLFNKCCPKVVPLNHKVGKEENAQEMGGGTCLGNCYGCGAHDMSTIRGET